MAAKPIKKPRKHSGLRKNKKLLIYLGKGLWKLGRITFKGEDIDGKLYEALDDLLLYGTKR